MNTELEYRVVPVTRFVVTRYANPDANFPNSASSGRSETRGEYDNEEVAHAVAYALAKREHEILGWAPDDMRIQYPRGNEGARIA